MSEEFVVVREGRPEGERISSVQTIRETDCAAGWGSVLCSAFDLSEVLELGALGLAMATLPGTVNLVAEDEETHPIAAAQVL